MKKLFSKEVIIGLSVAFAITILIIGIEFLKGVNIFKPANFYVAEYDNVEGLEVAAPVTIDGFKVGQVREINFDYENYGKINVVLALNKQLKVPVDSKAIIGSTLLSGSFIDIRLGKSSEMLPIGGIIESGTSPDIMASISNEVLPSISSIFPKVDSLLISVNRIASDPALVNSLKNIETITGNVSVASKNLNIVMQSQVPTILGGANRAVNNLDDLTTNLKLLSEELSRIPIASTMDNVNELTDNLAKFSKQLNNPNSTLGELTSDSELYHRINRLTADIDSLILDIQKNPKRYISIKLL